MSSLTVAWQVSSIIFLVVIFALNAMHVALLRHHAATRNKKQSALTTSSQQSGDANNQICLDPEQINTAVTFGDIIFPIASYIAFLGAMSSAISNTALYWQPNINNDNKLVCIAASIGIITQAIHKSGVLAYLFVRAQLTAFLVSRNLVRFAVAVGFVGMGTCLVLDVIIMANGFHCQTSALPLFRAVAIIYGGTDFFLSSILVVIFFRPMVRWMRSVASSEDSMEDNRLVKRVENLATSSIFAIVSTLISVVVYNWNPDLTFIPFMADMVVNCCVILYQYRVLDDEDVMVAVMTLSRTEQAKAGLPIGNLQVAESLPARDVGDQSLS